MDKEMLFSILRAFPDQREPAHQVLTTQVVEKARHAVLVCEASGSPKPTITWIKDTMPIDLKANPRLSLMKQGKLRGKAAVTIRKILHQDSPQYPVQLSWEQPVFQLFVFRVNT